MPKPPPLRIALYSHDTIGLGHMRRNLLLARALTHWNADAMVLLLAGAREVNVFSLAPRVDLLSLPALQKDGHGQYRPRSLNVALRELIDLRSRILRSALESFVPDVLIVDKVARGVLNELEPALESLRRIGRTRCVLGLRDILDEPEVVRAEWSAQRGEEAVRDYYSRVWVYGDPKVYNPVTEYGFGAATAAKVRFTGYLDRREAMDAESDRVALEPLDLPDGPVALCEVGGGHDGAQVAEAFAAAELGEGTCGVILTGPQMAEDARRRLVDQANEDARLRVVEFLPDPGPILRRADRVVSMGGYNSVCEILAYQKPALVIPRVYPRLEQWIRAERLRALGLIDVLHPDLASPRAITEWLGRACPPPDVRGTIDMDGLSRLPDLVGEVVRRRAGSARRSLLTPELHHAAC